MALSISDIIMQQVNSSAGKIDIPSSIRSTVLSGLSDSILGSLTQTAAESGGIDQIKSLLTGGTKAASSPITALAGSLFAKKISGLGLTKDTGNAVSALIPGILGNLSGFIKDRDGDGDVDLNDILISLTGGNSGGGLLGAAGSILGKFLKK